MELQEADAKEGSYRYLLLLGVVIVSWGIVPGFAKLGGLPGDVTTLYVNWIAVVAVALLITLQGKWHLFGQYSARDYAVMGAIGLVWPLAYSVTYFQSVQVGGPALTTILNYTWPIFCLVFARLLNQRSSSRISTLSVGLAVGAVGVAYLFEYQAGLALAGLALVLGLIAAASQGFYSAATDRWRYDPWAMTLVVEAVTAVGVSFVVALRGSFVAPTSSTLFYLGVIGAISNGIGFWAFLAGSQQSGRLGMTAKSTWLIGMCSVPFAQVLLLPIMGAESVSLYKWIGVGLISISFLVHRWGNTRATATGITT